MIESQNVLRRALNLTLAIYRLTKLLPREEPIGWQMRKLANEIIGDLSLENFKIAQKKIELILLFFDTAQVQEWVKPVNWEVLKKEYGELWQEIIFFDLKEKKERKKETKKEGEKFPEDMSHNIKEAEEKKKGKKGFIYFPRLRQKKILKEFESKKQMKISEIIPLFQKKISQRTLRNDLHNLIKKDLILRKGLGRSIIYLKK